MTDTGTPPSLPPQFQIYDSYVEDPKWQRKFSIIWASLVGFAILLSLPHLLRSIKTRRALVGPFGIWEDLNARYYLRIPSAGDKVPVTDKRAWKAVSVVRTLRSMTLFSLPGLRLNAGQIVVILGYFILVLMCVIMNATLIDNPNRAGFMALAQFPVVFLFATKNSILSLLLGPGNGYEQLNYIHRWSGRAMFLSGGVHGTLWIRNHLKWKLPIIGQQKETSGVAAFGLLCVIVLSSLSPVRKWAYQVFFVIHVLSFVAFFVTICYHTIYASPWIFPPLAFYGLDILLRMFKYRIKDATLTPIDNQMTIIRIPDCDGGWMAGQHVRLRVFFSGRVFESHPLTILNAPPAISCLKSSMSEPAIILGARVIGDWSKALNDYAQLEKERAANSAREIAKRDSAAVPERESGKLEECCGAQVQVMLDGPYGGCSLDLGMYENVLLFAGGSGATFTLGLLDDIVGRCVGESRRGGERTRKVEFAWCIRSFGSIEWLSPYLMDISTVASAPGSTLDLHISIFVTCLCNPEAVPPFPNSTVTIFRPSVRSLLDDLVNGTTSNLDIPESGCVEMEMEKANAKKDVEGGSAPGLRSGGVAVCASGPQSLTREASNAVARLSMRRGVELGGVALHTEIFSI